MPVNVSFKIKNVTAVCYFYITRNNKTIKIYCRKFDTSVIDLVFFGY